MIYKLSLKLNKNELLLAERLFVWFNGVQTAMEDPALVWTKVFFEIKLLLRNLLIFKNRKDNHKVCKHIYSAV